MFAPVQSQNNEIENGIAKTRVLSYQELLDEMVSCIDSVYQLNNAIVQYNVEKDKRFVAFRDSLAYTKLDTLKVEAKINLKNVSFKDYTFGNKSSDNTFLLFSKLEFEKEVSITDASVSNVIGFINSKFHSRFQITIDKESLDNKIYIVYCLFISYTHISVSNGRIDVQRSEFYPINDTEDKFFDIAHVFEADDESSFIQFAGNSFCKINDLDHTRIAGKLYALRCYENIFETDFNLHEMSIEDITMHDNEFQSLIDMTNVDFGSVKSEIFYKKIKLVYIVMILKLKQFGGQKLTNLLKMKLHQIGCFLHLEE